MRTRQRREGGPRRVLILGTDEQARELGQRLTARGAGEIRILGHVRSDEAAEGPLPVPVYTTAELPGILRRKQVDEVFACDVDCAAAVAACADAGVPVTLVAARPGEEPDSAYLQLAAGAQAQHSLGLGLKRTLDVAGAALALLMAAPVLGLAALAIQLSSPGAVVSRQLRCGLHGRRFALLRLRTGPARPGPRGARSGVGRLVHECGIDDLLQLCNVLKGDMSLVGPRPPLPAELARLGAPEARRLSMRPGLTCLWQLSERPLLGAEDCAKLDLEYVEGWSLRTDLKILALTVPAVLRGASG